MLSHEGQEKYLISRIGNPVNFTYPEGEGKKKGKLIDRIVCFSGDDGNVVYWNIIDLIRFENEEEDWIRFSIRPRDL